MEEQQYKQVIQNTFNEASAGYDKPAMKFFDNSALHLAESLTLRGDENLLDAATGTGKIAFALAARLKTGQVTGIDLSEGMLSRARQKAEPLRTSRVSFRRMDADNLEYPDGYFDGITCGFGVHFWQNMQKSLSANLLPKLKPGAFLAITSFAKGSFEPQSNLCLDRFKKYGVKLPPSYSWERLDSEEKNLALFESIGLKDIKIHRAQMGYYLAGAEQWWDLVLYTGFRAFLNQLSAEEAERYKSEHLREIAATADAKGIFLNVDVIFSEGRKKA